MTEFNRLVFFLFKKYVLKKCPRYLSNNDTVELKMDIFHPCIWKCYKCDVNTHIKFVDLTFLQTTITWDSEIPASLFYSSESHPSKSGLLHLWMKQFSSFATILAGNLLNAELSLVILVSTLLTDWSFFVPLMWDLATEGYTKSRENVVYLK